MSVEKRVAAYLELATKDAEAAELLRAGGNRYAAYHVQQAVEKITKALLLARGIEAGIEHRLEELFRRFADEDRWPERLHAFVSYSAYATAFRYPTPGGRIPADPPVDALRRDIASLRELIAAVRNELLGTAAHR
ncbi:MAG TPA: HEPN domain-containing protein [Kofleriaceae bacterium]|nr:HEPN domain-containing protein [Kofleriaceae bacterium]